MAITSEIIGKLGGAEVETISVNRLIKRGEGFQVLHTITVDRPSVAVAILTHDKSISFGDHATAVIAIRGTNDVQYSASYSVAASFGKPLSIAANLSAGTWTIEAICNKFTNTENYVSEYTAETLTVATVNL